MRSAERTICATSFTKSMPRASRLAKYDRLEEEARRLEHAEELRSLAQGMSSVLDGDEDAVMHRLGAVQRALANIQRIDPSLSRLQEMFDAAFYGLEELARELVDVRGRRGAGPGAPRRSRAAPRPAVSPNEEIRPDRGRRDGDGPNAHAPSSISWTRRRSTFASSLSASRRARPALNEAAATLTALRTAAADRLARAVDQVLPDLGIADGRFMAALPRRAEIGPSGAEDVEFRVALNVGHDARPLARVASGGELSRVMLALKTILARLDHVPTLVFDEVDAGIGGRVGLQVGETMRRVAAHHQVFAISHLPQIAARAHHHILVAKGARGGVTTADIAGPRRRRPRGGDRAHARRRPGERREPGARA